MLICNLTFRPEIICRKQSGQDLLSARPGGDNMTEQRQRVSLLMRAGTCEYFIFITIFQDQSSITGDRQSWGWSGLLRSQKPSILIERVLHFSVSTHSTNLVSLNTTDASDAK